MSLSALASLYTYKLKHQKMLEVFSPLLEQDLSKIATDRDAFYFIKMYGTHYVESAKMGARFQENIYFSEETSSDEIKQVVANASKNS